MANQIDRLEDDVAEIRRWTERHEERHGDDADMLGRVLDMIQEHTQNHHGIASRLRQGGALGALVSIVYAVAELLRRFAF